MLLSKVISIYMILVVVDALLSWLPGAYDSKLAQLLGRIVDPFQRIFNFATVGVISFAPVLALIVLEIFRDALGIWLPNLIMKMME